MNIYRITEYGVKSGLNTLQTAQIQAVFDLCKAAGGIVVFPKGEYRVSSLRMWSDMTLQFEPGAILYGSTECDDYEVYAVPEGVEMRSDMEMITQYYNNKPWDTYSRAMISAYGEKNLTIVGTSESIIDGCDCYDPDGEEGFRGPHGIYFTNCENIKLYGYTIQNNSNFMHQIDNCRNIHVKNVTCLARHDGIHLHCCVDTLIEDCNFTTGDDCIAGINMENLHVRRCVLNTSCDLFCAGGSHILVEDCHMSGLGYYLHCKTVVKSKTECLSREEGRHNLICLLTYFSSTNYPAPEPSHDIVFRNCVIENPDFILHYIADGGTLQSGTYLQEMTFENVTFRGVGGCSVIEACEKIPLTIILKNIKADFAPNATDRRLFADNHPYTTVIVTDCTPFALKLRSKIPLKTTAVVIKGGINTMWKVTFREVKGPLRERVDKPEHL